MKKKEWYLYTRNEIFYFNLINPITGKKMTARSTGTKDKDEAIKIATKNLILNDENFYKSQKEKDRLKVQELIEKYGIQFLIDEIEKKQSITRNSKLPLSSDEIIVDDDASDNIKELAKKINSMTLVDFLILYFDYENSPYLKELENEGLPFPGEKDFKKHHNFFKKYRNDFESEKKINDITAKNINSLITKYQQNHDLKE